MKKLIYRALLVTLSSSILLSPVSLHAWCWIRDSGKINTYCGGGSTYQQDCCSGNLRVWNGAAMTYRVSTNTSSTLYSDIEAGYNRWNDVEMATFVFTRGTNTSATTYTQDGINLINIDSAFCTTYPAYCGMGVLGFSGTWTSTTGGYHATESDIILNGEEYSWGDGTAGTINTIAVIAHESGHSAGVTHPGSTCRSSGSAGCGPEFSSATMYYNYSGGQPTDKTSLELDDVASIVYGYPRSTFRVWVRDSEGIPVSGATVELIGTAVPVNGTSIATGGSVYGDISGSYIGDGVSSSTYVSSTPFSTTNGSGYTNYVSPVHQTFTLRATYNGKTFYKRVTVADGVSSVIMYLVPPVVQSIYLLLLY